MATRAQSTLEGGSVLQPLEGTVQDPLGPLLVVAGELQEPVSVAEALDGAMAHAQTRAVGNCTGSSS